MSQGLCWFVLFSFEFSSSRRRRSILIDLMIFFSGAGHCGSGRDDDCGTGIWHELLCCPYEYPFTYSGYGIDFELRFIFFPS